MTARAEPPPPRWWGRAFGLDIDLSFEAPGLPELTGAPGERRTRADLVAPEEIDAGWPETGVERMLEERFGSAEPERAIDAHPTAGFRLYAEHFGLARLSPSGDRILCSPPDVEPWNWQRFLVGRILPWAAVLRGLEAFHASAVAVGGRAFAFVGPTGAGKTSLAIQLVARGARFLTDDVLALERGGGGLVAHPGAAIASVRPSEREAIPAATWDGLGAELGHSGKTYLALERAEAAPLGAVYFLRAGSASGPAIEPVERPDPRMLLASTFVLGVRTPERLRNQLDVCAALVRDVPLFWLGIDPAAGSRRLAEAVDAHMRGVRGNAMMRA
ncbi:MAG TPA: hypothetical protein VF715_04010 [Thermoleophilaceae bacterium]